MSLEELEELYISERDVRVPTGVFRGQLLRWLPRSEGQPRWLRPLLRLGFELTPFGVDFDRQRWFFGHDLAPRLGRFSAAVGSSRWRPTLTVRLDYGRSRLPGPIRRQLYDEVKPLSATLCLGLGGINAEAGRGEQFFFALDKIGPRLTPHPSLVPPAPKPTT